LVVWYPCWWVAAQDAPRTSGGRVRYGEMSCSFARTATRPKPTSGWN